jgi:hypothetical protein
MQLSLEGKRAFYESYLSTLRWHTEAECSWVHRLALPGAVSGIWVGVRIPKLFKSQHLLNVLRLELHFRQLWKWILQIFWQHEAVDILVKTLTLI